MNNKELISKMQQELQELESIPNPNSDTRKWIGELTEILRTAQTDGYQSDLALFKYSFLRTPIPRRKQNRNIDEIIEAEDYVDLLTQYQRYAGDDSLIKEFFSQSFLNDLGRDLEDEFKNMDRETLLQTTLEYAFGNEFLSRKCEVLLERIKYLENKLNPIRAKRLSTAKKKGAGRIKKFQPDTEFATVIYQRFVAELKRKIEPEDFSEYLFRIREGRAVPQFIPKARLTAEEKDQTLTEQEIIRDVKARNEWSEARLRKLFMKLSGLKSTKKSRVKS